MSGGVAVEFSTFIGQEYGHYNQNNFNSINNINNFYNFYSKIKENYESSLNVNQIDPINTEIQKYKTEMCNNFLLNGYCKYDGRCKFAHGKNELAPKKVKEFYKQRKCETFFSKGACSYGSRCTFKHDERKANEIFSSSYSSKLNLNTFNFEESDSNSKSNGVKRLKIFSEITDEKISFDSSKIVNKIENKKNSLKSQKLVI